MSKPIFSLRQKVRVKLSQNKTLVGAEVYVNHIHKVRTTIWDGHPNSEPVYQFYHGGETYGCLESQLVATQSDTTPCGLSFEAMIYEINKGNVQ